MDIEFLKNLNASLKQRCEVLTDKLLETESDTQALVLGTSIITLEGLANSLGEAILNYEKRKREETQIEEEEMAKLHKDLEKMFGVF